MVYKVSYKDVIIEEKETKLLMLQKMFLWLFNHHRKSKYSFAIVRLFLSLPPSQLSILFRNNERGLFFLPPPPPPPPPPTSLKHEINGLTSGFTRLIMKSKYVCHGRISLHVNFHDNRTKWLVISNIKISRWGGGGEEKEPERGIRRGFTMLKIKTYCVWHVLVKLHANFCNNRTMWEEWERIVWPIDPFLIPNSAFFLGPKDDLNFIKKCSKRNCMFHWRSHGT